MDQLFGQWRKCLHWSDKREPGNINKHVSGKNSGLSAESRVRSSTLNSPNAKVCNPLHQLITQMQKSTEEVETLKLQLYRKEYSSEIEVHSNTSGLPKVDSEADSSKQVIMVVENQDVKPTASDMTVGTKKNNIQETNGHTQVLIKTFS